MMVEVFQLMSKQAIVEVEDMLAPQMRRELMELMKLKMSQVEPALKELSVKFMTI